VNQHQYSWY